jgi:hypothetical protein
MNDIERGRGKTKEDAAKAVERLIEQALSPKKRPLAPPASNESLQFIPGKGGPGVGVRLVRG